MATGLGTGVCSANGEALGMIGAGVNTGGATAAATGGGGNGGGSWTAGTGTTGAGTIGAAAGGDIATCAASWYTGEWTVGCGCGVLGELVTMVCDCVRERPIRLTCAGGKPKLYSTISSSKRLRLIERDELQN